MRCLRCLTRTIHSLFFGIYGLASPFIPLFMHALFIRIETYTVFLSMAMEVETFDMLFGEPAQAPPPPPEPAQAQAPPPPEPVQTPPPQPEQSAPAMDTKDSPWSPSSPPPSPPREAKEEKVGLRLCACAPKRS